MTYIALKRLNRKDPAVFEVSKGSARYIAKRPTCAAKRAHAELFHDGIERIVVPDVYLDGNNTDIFTLFEKIMGAPLDTKVLTFEQSAAVAIELSDILSYMHERKWAHADLKPENVVIANDCPRIIDLEFCCHVDDPKSPFAHFSYNYAAPEQLLVNDLSTAVDIYALGCMIHDAFHPQGWSGKPQNGQEFRNVKKRLQEHRTICAGHEGYSQFILVTMYYHNKLSALEDQLDMITPLAILHHPNPIVRQNRKLSLLLQAMVDLEPECRPTADDVYSDLLYI